MGVVTNIIDAVRRFGGATQKTAIQRQDEQLVGRRVTERRMQVSRSELGKSESFVATHEPVPETVVPLTEEDLAPILENAALFNDFVAAFTQQPTTAGFLAKLDTAFGAWIQETDKKGYSDDAVLEIAGAAFGKFCADSLNMRWVRVTDSSGTAIAVQGRYKDFRGFPYAAISKRIPVGEYGFFTPIYISLQDAAERDWEPTGAT